MLILRCLFYGVGVSMVRKNQIHGQQVAGTSDCGEKTTSSWGPQAPCLLDHTVGEMLLGCSAALRSTHRDVYTLCQRGLPRHVLLGHGVLWGGLLGDWHLQAECFSSGAGPASVTATAPVPVPPIRTSRPMSVSICTLLEWQDFSASAASLKFSMDLVFGLMGH